MSAFNRLEEIVRHTDCSFLDEHWTWDTDPHQITTELVAEHRAEVLVEDGQAYDGELAMLRGLVRTLRATARYGTDMREVQQLLAEHAADDAAARLNVGEEATAPAAPATPDFFRVGREYRATQHASLRFRCLAVDTHPDTGEVRAFGWRQNERTGLWRPAGLDPDDWACCDWTDVTDTTRKDGRS